MNSQKGFLSSPRFGVVLLLLSFFNLLYWTIAQYINVYKTAVVGAIYELFWLPALLLLAIIPLFSVITMIKTKKVFSSFAFYALLVAATTIIVIAIKTAHPSIS